MLHQVKRELVPTDVHSADIISGIVAAVDMIRMYCRHLKYIKNIYLLTNGRYPRPLSESEDDLNAIKDEMVRSNIQFKVLGVDFDDTETGFVEGGERDPSKKSNEAVIKSICEIPDAVFANAEEAINSLREPSVKKPRPVKTFTGKLMLGDISSYPVKNVVSIDVEAFPCTRLATPMTAVSYATSGKPAASQAATQGADDASKLMKAGLQEVKRLTEFYVKDEDAPEGMTEIESTQVQSGYRFGSEIVVLSPEEETVLKAQSHETASMLIVGFVKEKDIPRYMSMSNTDYVVAAKDNKRAGLALSSLINALFIEKSAALIRYVQKDNKDVKMCALTPLIEQDFEALVLTHLPFAQDQRHYRFPPLGEVRVKDKETGVYKTATEHPIMIPTDDMQEAMDQFVDEMDLMEADEDGFEYAPPDQVYNPLIHRIKHVVKYCALMDDTEHLPEILPVLKKYSVPPKSRVEAAADTIAKLEDLMATKRIETKEERKERVQQEKELKTASGVTQSKDEPRVDEKPIDLAAILTSVAPQKDTVKSEPDSIKSEPSVASQPANVGPDLVHLSTSVTDVKITSSSPVRDFANAVELALRSQNKNQILINASTQVTEILIELLEISSAPTPAIDATIQTLLDDLAKAVGMVDNNRRLCESLRSKFQKLVDDEEIGDHLVKDVMDTINKL